tara:strand:+ start:1420 stop:2016 length:597 start_codon:yes stop_codon:yes gene_type:complete
MTNFVSLGMQCNVAEEFKKRGKRRYSLPYDWLYIGSYTDVIRLLKCRNQILFEKDFWVKNINDHNQYINKALNNTGSRHFFDSDLSNFEEITQLFKKRTTRLFNLFSSNEKIEFVRDQQWYILDPLNFFKFLDDFKFFFNKNYPNLDWRLTIFVDSKNKVSFVSYGINTATDNFRIIFVDSKDSTDWRRPMIPWDLIF